MKGFTSRETSEKLGLDASTLARYIAAGKVPTPKIVRLGNLRVQVWSDADIEKVRKILPKIANGRKTRYQKERAKKKGSRTTINKK